MRKHRIAIIGCRGIPARYGGFERIAEELSTRLVRRGHIVYVACEKNLLEIIRRSPKKSIYKGVMLVYFPIIESIRIISEVLYDFLSLIWASLTDVDVIYLLGYSAAPAVLIPKIFGKVVLVNVNGLEWKRQKFNSLIKAILRIMEKIVVKLANIIIVDSKVIGRYYLKNYGTKTYYVPNGLSVPPTYAPKMLSNIFSIKPNDYYLVVARLEPENNIDMIVKSFMEFPTEKKLVIVGPLKRTSFVKKLVELALKDEKRRIIFVGGVYDKRLLTTLRKYCFAYIHGHEVGGTNPSLVEAMACQNLILALDTPFNREVAGVSGLYFRKNIKSLRMLFELVEKLPAEELIRLRGFARKIYQEKFTPEKMLESFEEILYHV